MTDYNRKPEIWNDEDGDFAWVDLTAQTATLDSALAWLIEHGHEELELFDSILYEAAEGATIDPASIECRGIDIIVGRDALGGSYARFHQGRPSDVGVPELLPATRLLESGEASATWRFDISVAALREARDAA